MLRLLLALLTLSLCSFSLAQTTGYAPDLRWDSSVRSYLGVVNPARANISISVSGFQKDGTLIATLGIPLGPYGRVEASAFDLFGDQIAWASVFSEHLYGGYVRYTDLAGKQQSLAPLSQTAGRETWAAQINTLDGAYSVKTALINVASAQGSASLTPVTSRAIDSETTVAEPGEVSTPVPEFGEPFQQTLLEYGAVFEKTDNLLWDRLTAGGEAALTGIQHFQAIGEGSSGLASANLPRTPYRDLIVSPLQPNQPGTFNKIVLVNTYPTTLPVDLNAHFEYFGFVPGNQMEPESIRIDLKPYEKRVFDLGDPFQVELPASASWFHIHPHEGGLIGYQLFGNKNGQGVAAVEAGAHPSSGVSLPYTPTNLNLQTEISLINPTKNQIIYYIMGYINSGRRMAFQYNQRLFPGEKKTFDMETLFGEKADEITWVRALTTKGQLMAQSVVRSRDGDAMAALQGIPEFVSEGNLFEANFDHFQPATIEGQKWSPMFLTVAGENYRLPYLAGFTVWGNNHLPGEFFIEHAFESQQGYFYFGYEPYYNQYIQTEASGERDTVVMMSPFIEVPSFGTYYLSYHMRFHNPQYATRGSRFGMVWRQEGSNEWHWFGLKGSVWQNPPLILTDCLVDIQYRNEIATISDWFPFEMQLPDTLNGKRIQVGYYYDFEPEDEESLAPIVFMDQIRISADPLEFSLFYPNQVGSFFTVPEETEQEE